jgi:hypothetical protein
MGWTRKWWLVIAIFFAVAFIVVVWKEKRCQAEAYQCRAAYASQAQSERTTIPLAVDQQASEQQEITAACEPNSYLCRLFGAANLPSVLLVLIGAGGIWAALRTLNSIERQSSIMEKQMKSVAGKERPRITVILKDPTFNEGTGIVGVTIDCWCPSPAFIGRAEGESYVGRGVVPGIPSYLPLPLSGQIYATKQIEGFFPIFSGDQMATIDIELLRSKKIFLYCRGIIKYRGVHLADNDWPYKTSFSKRWVPETTPISGLVNGFDGYWEDYPNAEENRQT